MTLKLTDQQFFEKAIAGSETILNTILEEVPQMSREQRQLWLMHSIVMISGFLIPKLAEYSEDKTYLEIQEFCLQEIKGYATHRAMETKVIKAAKPSGVIH